MQRLRKIIDRVHHHNTKKDWDSVWIIAGDEGCGKSNLLLHIIDYWYTNFHGGVTPEKIKHISLSLSDFAKDFKDVKKYGIISFDEAGQISNRRTMSKLNELIKQTYQIVRGHNLFTILLLPSVFDIEPSFPRRRARALIQVYERGKFSFYGREKLRKVIEINQDKKIRRVDAVTPLFRDNFPVYNGALKEEYMKRKEEFISEAKAKLDEFINSEPDAESEKKLLLKSELDRITKMEEVGLTQDQIGHVIGKSARTVRRLKGMADGG